MANKYRFTGSVNVGSFGSGSRSVVGAIGENAVGAVNVGDGHPTTETDELIVGAIGEGSVGTVDTDGTSKNVVGAVGDGAVGTVNIRVRD